MNVSFYKGALSGLTAAALLAAPAAQAQTAATPPVTAAPAPSPPAATSTAALAPAGAATPVAPPAGPSRGPLIQGVCLLSQEAVIARSKVGQAATARLRELAAQAQTNLNAEKSRLEARGKALGEKRATLTPMQIQAQSQALNQRAQALQAEAGERTQQIDATKTRAFGEVLQQARPYIDQAYAAHGCGLLFAREAVLTGNLGNDLTDEVLTAFNAKGTPITFDLEPAPKAR
jgi:Skp family chaperone for outer membrane proteins